MAEALTVASMALGAFGSISKFMSADQAKADARADARRQEAETQEMLRQEARADAAQESRALAAAAASGATVSGSLSKHLDEMSQENLAHREWIKKSGKSKADIIKRQGKRTSDAQKIGAIGDLASTASAGASWFK